MTQSVFTDRYDRFRRLLIEARLEAGVSQEELARRLGRPQSFVSKFEHADRRLDVVEFLEVAEALGIDPVALIRKLASHKKRSWR